jgi:GNAT superfamily N-acetyltransferase
MTIASRIQALPAWHHLVFRLITKADVDAVAELYFLCFGVRPPPTYIRWRYLETPTGLTPTMLAFDQGICVGCYALWPTGLLLDGRPISGGQAIDSMTHPDYRGRGLFVEVAEHCYDDLRKLGYQVLYGFPNDAAYSVRVRRLNWHHVTDIHHWARPLWLLDPPQVGGLIAAASLLWPLPAAASGLRIETVRPDSEAIAVLLDSAETKSICRVQRSAEWLAWRYHADSGGDYRWIAVYAGDALRCFAVWRFDPVSRRALLGELVGHPQSFPAGLRSALSSAHACRARVLSAFTNDAGLVQLLRSSGFIRRSSERFMVRSLTGSTLPANIHLAATWRISGGDFDAF